MPHLGTSRIDELWSAEWEETDGVLYRRLFQPTRNETMRQIRDVRENKLINKDAEPIGRWCLSIPHEDYRRLMRSAKWQELGAPDHETSQKAWRKFLCSPDSAPYRVQERAS